MKTFCRTLLSFVALFPFSPLNAALITVVATASDRGIDTNNDGVFESVFGNPSVVQITVPPTGVLGSQEFTAVEFPLALVPSGSIIETVTLRLSPQGPITGNLGIDATETATIQGYSGDGVISVADMHENNLVGSIAGPTLNGVVTTVIDTLFMQSLVDAAATHAGLLFNAVQVPAMATLYNFFGTFSGIPEDRRPQLIIETSDSTDVPEPAIIALFAAGIFGLGIARKKKLDRISADII